MTKIVESPTVTKRLAAEHRHLSKATQQLRALAAGPVTEEGLPFWRQDLQSRLSGFRSLLLAHFKHEEEGGFLQDVVREVPNSQQHVAKLRHEHADLERRLDTVIAELGELEKPERAEAIQRKVAVLTEILVKHETDEQHLVQRTYYREYGGE